MARGHEVSKAGNFPSFSLEICSTAVVVYMIACVVVTASRHFLPHFRVAFASEINSFLMNY